MMITIRPAKPEGVIAIGEIHMRAITVTSSGHYPREVVEAWATPRDPSFYLHSITNKEFYVATDKETIVGFGSFNPESREVEGLFVAPGFGGRGIGRKLLSKLEQRAQSLKINSVYLKASLNAVSFYERAGYTRREESRHRLQSGAEIPCVIMDKEL